MLGHGRRTDVEVLRQLFKLADSLRWRDQPAEAPAGHTEVLGEAVEHERRVVDFQHTGRIGAIGEAVVDLVHHQMPAAAFQRSRQASQIVPCQQGTGGIGRRSYQGAHAVLVPVPLDQIGRQLITHIRADRDQLRGTFDQAQEVPVAGIPRVGQQPMLAWVDQQTAGQ